MMHEPTPVTRRSLDAWPMYRAMVGVGLFTGLVIVTAFVATRPVIERKRAEALQQAIFDVLPSARSSVTFRLTSDERLVMAGAGVDEGRLVHAAHDESGAVIGVAIEARGAGYQDTIRVLYGYSFADEAVIGFRVLESRETPGLGARAANDPDFLANFDQLDVALSADGTMLAHAIESVRHGEKQHGWEIDGITGATVTSQAIASMLNASVAFWIPRVRKAADDFLRPGRSEVDELSTR